MWCKFESAGCRHLKFITSWILQAVERKWLTCLIRIYQVRRTFSHVDEHGNLERNQAENRRVSHGDGLLGPRLMTTETRSLYLMTTEARSLYDVKTQMFLKARLTTTGPRLTTTEARSLYDVKTPMLLKARLTTTGYTEDLLYTMVERKK